MPKRNKLEEEYGNPEWIVKDVDTGEIVEFRSLLAVKSYMSWEFNKYKELMLIPKKEYLQSEKEVKKDGNTKRTGSWFRKFRTRKENSGSKTC